MLPIDVKKEVDALDALNVALMSMHSAALGLLESCRKANGKCIRCGIFPPVGKDEDYCPKCFDEWVGGGK